MDAPLPSQKKKKPFSLQGPVMVYLYKCPFCVFGEMDSTKGCGSDDFISTAFLSVVFDQSFDRGNVTHTVSPTLLYKIQYVQSECRLFIYSKVFVNYNPYNKGPETVRPVSREQRSPLISAGYP